MTAKRTIEVDDTTAATLEKRAAEAGLSVSELLADMVARREASGHRPPQLRGAGLKGLDAGRMNAGESLRDRGPKGLRPAPEARSRTEGVALPARSAPAQARKGRGAD
jgi:hypothetical protein